MPALQSINLGTAPDGTGGDTSRSAFTKINANTDTVQSGVPLTYAVLSDSVVLKPADVGSRFILGTAAGKVITLPLASAVSRNSVVHLANNGNLVTVSVQGTDVTEITALSRGDWAAYVSDGVKYWHVMARGKMLPDETITGSLSVNGALSAGSIIGDLAATGKLGGVVGANLLVNSTGELGNTGWSGTNFTSDRDAVGGNGTFFRNAAALNGSPLYSYSDYVPSAPGIKVAIQGLIGSAGMTAGAAAIGVEFLDASNTLLSVVSPSVVTFGSAPTFRTATGTAPANTAKMRFRIGVTASPAGPAGAATYTNLKYELGTTISTYSQEASIAYLGGAPAFTGRPTFGGNVPWDSGNLAPSNYVARRAGNDIANTYFASGTMPNIAGIDAARYDACLTISNNRNTAASAIVQFHREGSYAAYFGLDTDNYWKVGGRSMGANAYRVVHEGIDGATLGGWLQINGAKAMTYANYGFLSQGGAGNNPGSVGNAGVALYCPGGRVVAGEFDALSDARLKTDIVQIDSTRAIEFVLNVDPVAFRWKGDESGAQNFGFIAQGIGKAGFTELLRTAPDKRVEETVDADGWVSPAGVRFSVNYDQVVPIHSSVLRSLLRRVEALESRIEALGKPV